MTERKMNKTVSSLIHLASCAVNDEKPDPAACDGVDMGELYRLADFHGIASTVASALQSFGELPRDFDQALKKNIRRLALFDIDRGKILKRLEAEGIWYLPLKGIILKEFYPKRAMREMSDNDILCDSTRMADVKAVMEGLGYTCDDYDNYYHDCYSKPPTLDFEMHRSLFSDDIIPRFAAYYENIADKLLTDSDSPCLRLMTDEDMYIYLMCHLYKHYKYAGTGLRSLLDIYLYVKRRYSSMDKEYISDELDKLSITGFEERIRSLSNKLFTAQPLTESESETLRYFLISGNNGIADHHDYFSMESSLGGDDSAGSKRRFILSRIFISGESLRESYPFFYKHKLLYPLLFVYRPIKGALTHPTGIFREYKDIKSFKKDDKMF